MNPYLEEMVEKSQLPSTYEQIQEVINRLPELEELLRVKDQILAKGIDFDQEGSVIYWKYSDQDESEYKKLFDFETIGTLVSIGDIVESLGSSDSKVPSQRFITDELARKKSTDFEVLNSYKLLESQGNYILDFSLGSFHVELPYEVTGDYEFKIINNSLDETVPYISLSGHKINGKSRNVNLDSDGMILHLKFIDPEYGFKLVRY